MLIFERFNDKYLLKRLRHVLKYDMLHKQLNNKMTVEEIKMKLIKIKRWDNDEVIFSHDCGSIKEAVEEAVGRAVNLAYADLKDVNLESASLEGANLIGAKLEGANLKWAELKGANLKNANLENANLESAILKNTILKRTILKRANLKHADLFDTNLHDAITDDNQQ